MIKSTEQRSGGYPGSVLDRVGGLDDDDLAPHDASGRDSPGSVRGAEIDERFARPSLAHDEYGPAIARAEQSRGRNSEHVLPFPHDDRCIHAVVVSEAWTRRLREVEDDVNALLLEAECRHLRERRRIDATDAGVHRLGASPSGDSSGGPGADARHVARQQICVDFEARNVADLEKWCPGCDGASALA